MHLLLTAILTHACRIYILAQLLAALLACSIFAFVSGWGPLFPMTSMKQLDLSYMEAVMMWATGSPLQRLQDKGLENVTDLLEARKQSVTAKLFNKLKNGKGTDNVTEV